MFPQPGSSTVSARGRGIVHTIAALRKTQAMLLKRGSMTASVSAALTPVVAMLTLAQHVMALADALRLRPAVIGASVNYFCIRKGRAAPKLYDAQGGRLRLKTDSFRRPELSAQSQRSIVNHSSKGNLQ